MSVKIIIDRKVRKGMESDFSKLLEELRMKAIATKGYISGESLWASEDRQNCVVISTWHSAEEWRNWEKSPERKEIHGKIEKLMVRLTKVKTYLNA